MVAIIFNVDDWSNQKVYRNCQTWWNRGGKIREVLNLHLANWEISRWYLNLVNQKICISRLFKNMEACAGWSTWEIWKWLLLRSCIQGWKRLRVTAASKTAWPDGLGLWGVPVLVPRHINLNLWHQHFNSNLNISTSGFCFQLDMSKSFKPITSLYWFYGLCFQLQLGSAVWLYFREICVHISRLHYYLKTNEY